MLVIGMTYDNANISMVTQHHALPLPALSIRTSFLSVRHVDRQ